MKEQHRRTLRDGLDRLPRYDPPAGDWDALQRRLDAEAPLQRALRQLPEYDPPDRVWTGIEAGLQAPARRIQLRHWLSVAAAVALLVVAYQWWAASPQGTTKQLADLQYATETVDDRLLAQVPTDEDEAYFARLLKLCDEQPIGCQRPDVQSLQRELAELTEARAELQAAIGAYGTDPDLLQQIKTIELDRTRIAQALLNAVV